MTPSLTDRYCYQSIPSSPLSIAKDHNELKLRLISRQAFFLCLAAMLFPLTALLPLTAFAQGGAFLENNGLVVIEAESIDISGDWVIESSDAGFTGSGYMRWNGPDFFGTPGNGTIAIPFKVNSPGNYYVKLRMSHLGAPAGDQWNDAWMKMNDSGTFVKAVHPSTYIGDGFTFHTTLEPMGGVFNPPLYNIPAGENTLYLSGRSYNLRIDRIHIYKSGTPDPENPNSPESAREDGDGGGGDGGGDGGGGDGGGGDGGGGGGVYTFTVENGTGGGIYPSGTIVNISANAPGEDEVFDQWVGSTQYLGNAFSSQTTFSIPGFDANVAATYRSSALREPENPVGAVSQLAYEYYEGSHDFLPDFDTLTPVSTGTTPVVDISLNQQPDAFSFRYTGYVDIPADGTYTFYTASDDGSQLFIGDVLIVDNDSIQSVQERSGIIGLKTGKHAFTVTYFERTGDQSLTASWAGPNISKQPIPATAFFHGGTDTGGGGGDGGDGGTGTPLGDVSLNGTISALDASQVLSHAIGQIPLDASVLSIGDVSGNGEVTAYDASLILQYVVQVITCFPAEITCTVNAIEPDERVNIFNMR
ncbi:MAG: PA14 domain-containing protein [Rhodothermales bacterium]